MQSPTLAWTKGYAMLTWITIMGVFSFSPPAFSQSCLGHNASSTSTTAHYWGLQASSSTNNCASDRKVEVQGWFSGASFTSCTGTVQGSQCKKESTGSNVASTVTVGKNNACGTGTGKSNHYAWNPSATIAEQVETTVETNQCSGGCEDYTDMPSCSLGEPTCQWSNGTCITAPGSPIIMVTDRKAKYELTSAHDGVLFDIDGDGDLDLVAWTKADTPIAFLALDRNGDGRITNGKELFGNYTLPGAVNGFDALQQTAMATNGGKKRGEVSENDPVFSQLLLWTDDNHNGVSDLGELRPVTEVFSAIGLGYEVKKNLEDEFGNKFLFRGWAHIRTAKGKNSPKSADEDKERTIHIWDVYFKIVG